MLTRIITALVALCVFVPVIIFSNTWVFPIAIAICSFIAVYEICKCVDVLMNSAVVAVLLLSALSIPILVRVVPNLAFFTITSICIFLVVILYLLTLYVFSKGAMKIGEIAVASFMSFYVVIGFSSIIILRDHFHNGEYTYLLIFVGAWITDTFAYFTGILFGKHKLIPEVSPKKTIEGSIGGTLFSGIAFVVFGVVMNSLSIELSYGHIQLFVFGLIAALVAQIGDLCMSALKRQYGIKDFGKIFPGHGGILDRFDSIIAVGIVLFIINTFVGLI